MLTSQGREVVLGQSTLSLSTAQVKLYHAYWFKIVCQKEKRPYNCLQQNTFNLQNSLRALWWLVDAVCIWTFSSLQFLNFLPLVWGYYCVIWIRKKFKLWSKSFCLLSCMHIRTWELSHITLFYPIFWIRRGLFFFKDNWNVIIAQTESTHCSSH